MTAPDVRAILAAAFCADHSDGCVPNSGPCGEAYDEADVALAALEAAGLVIWQRIPTGKWRASCQHGFYGEFNTRDAAQVYADNHENGVVWPGRDEPCVWSVAELFTHVPLSARPEE